MSEEYEVPAHHEQHLEHQAQHEAEHQHQGQHGGLSQQVAMFTAVLATLGAIVSYLGGHTQNEALYYKNDAVLNRALASDQWAYYQAKGIKQAIAEEQAEAASDPARAAGFRDKAQTYAKEKDEIKAKAEQFDRQSEAANQHAEHALHPHEKLAMAMTLIQIGISAASITALTRRRWLFALAGASALAGIAIWVLAFTV